MASTTGNSEVIGEAVALGFALAIFAVPVIAVGIAVTEALLEN